MRRWIGAVVATTALLMTAIGAPAAVATEYPNFSASCSVSGDSTFTNTGSRAAYFAWVWREGSTVLGYDFTMTRLGAGQSVTVDTSDSTDPDATTATRFGVVKGNGRFAYVTCTA